MNPFIAQALVAHLLGITHFSGTLIGPTGAHQTQRNVIPLKPAAHLVGQETLKNIYDTVKTPYKYGVVIRGETQDELVDSPSVFRFKGKWYLMYIAIRKGVGYQTYLATSNDLLHWQKLGRVLSFTDPNKWDAWQADGGVALCDYRWNGTHELAKFDGKYWLSYIGGEKQGYETDPLSLGMAWTSNPATVKEWERIPENPILSPSQPDSRGFEKLTLYRSQIIQDKSKSLGWPFVMFYNAKTVSGYERIGMAVSNNMTQWFRYGQDPVVDNGSGISGDPQIVKIGDVWTMFYFGAFWKPKAFNTFACSYDLVHWTRWEGSHLVEPTEPFDELYAHKSWVVRWKGVTYHFYDAVGSEGRVIALATSKDLK